MFHSNGQQEAQRTQENKKNDSYKQTFRSSNWSDVFGSPHRRQCSRSSPRYVWQFSPEAYSCPYTGTTTAQGRPFRSNRGTGGQLAQLEKASAVVGEGLLNKVTGQKRDRNNLINIPEDLSENDLAPPIPTKRPRTCARTSKTVIIIYLWLRNEYH